MADRLSHAYLLIGPEGPGRDEAEERLAAALLCEDPAGDAPCGVCRHCEKVKKHTHPDLIVVERQPGAGGNLRQEIVVDQIRDVTAAAAVAPNEAERKVYLIRQADRMNIAAQNALLKVLEEPPGHACFLLSAAAADALLPTVRSRCLRRDASLRTVETPPLTELAQAFLDLAAAGDGPGLVRFCLLRASLAREGAETQLAKDLLEELSGVLGDILCGRRPNPGLTTESLLRLIDLMDECVALMRRNVLPKQIYGLLAAESPGAAQPRGKTDFSS